MAWMPPYVAQVPARDNGQRLRRQAIDPLARGDRLAGIRIRCPSPPSSPSFLIFSLGIEPSTTSTKGIQSALLRLIEKLHEFVADSRKPEQDCADEPSGKPGIAPSRTSSMLGWSPR